MILLLATLTLTLTLTLSITLTIIITINNLLHTSTRIFLVDYTCYRAPDSYRIPLSTLNEHIFLDPRFHPDSVAFQKKILQNSGFSDRATIPPSLHRLPIKKSFQFAQDEALAIVFPIVTALLNTTNIHANDINILITNSCVFNPTPTLASALVNRFQMRHNVRTFNLSGMGCSAGIASLDMAAHLLRAHKDVPSLALVVSTEVLNLNWYTGRVRSMLLPQCLFRMGGAAILMSNCERDRKNAKYELKHIIRTMKAQDDRSYGCIAQDTDRENNTGVSISKDIIQVAGGALKMNISKVGPLVLPLKEQFRFLLSLIIKKKGSIYVPKFKKCFEHFCIHAGGKAIIEAIEKNLKLGGEDMEASKMTLYRFGNTSSSSIWYELSYIESKGKMRKEHRVWQLAFGSGFKCNSAVWKCLKTIEPGLASAWRDSIDSYSAGNN